MNQKSAIKELKAAGWTQSVGGKHSVKMVKPGERPITLPMKRGSQYGKGLEASIRREAGL